MNQFNQSTQVESLDAQREVDVSHARIAYIEVGWHNDIVSQARHAFIERIAMRGIGADQVELISVPGSLEIPLQAKLLAKTGDFDLIIAAGLIVDGGIYRHDFVARTVLDAMMQVSLAGELPVLSVVLTPHHLHESGEHHDFFYNHFNKKGLEAANACIQMLENMQAIQRRHA